MANQVLLNPFPAPPDPASLEEQVEMHNPGLLPAAKTGTRALESNLSDLGNLDATLQQKHRNQFQVQQLSLQQKLKDVFPWRRCKFLQVPKY